MAQRKKKTSSLWHVLIAEDDEKSAQHLKTTLNRLAKCQIVKNGQEAILTHQTFLEKNHPFDFILLDVTMPLLDGFEALKVIRAKEESKGGTSFKPAHIIMTTAYRDSLMERYNMGWDEYITKPVDPQRLIQKMKQMFKST